MSSEAIRRFIDESKSSDIYLVESAKIDFALSLERQRRRKNISYKSIAERLGTSAAYISKVFRGDANLTIESLVKMAKSVDGRLRLEVEDATAGAQWLKYFEQKTMTSSASNDKIATQSNVVHATFGQREIERHELPHCA